jgi:hypothetical protein
MAGLYSIPSNLPLSMPDWSNPAWQEALRQALRDTLATFGLFRGTCSCEPGPCPHRAQAWADEQGEWSFLLHQARKYGVEPTVREFIYDYTGELDITPIRPVTDVRLWRDDEGRAYASVPHWPYYSERVEWGYEGSGPADLARSILIWFYGLAVAKLFTTDFKRQVIARIPRDVTTYTIAREVIAQFVEQCAARRAEWGF